MPLSAAEKACAIVQARNLLARLGPVTQADFAAACWKEWGPVYGESVRKRLWDLQAEGLAFTHEDRRISESTSKPGTVWEIS